MKRYQKIILPIAALLVGLIFGLGIGQMKVASVKKAAQAKVKEANKKAAFIQKRLLEEQSKPPEDQNCRGDLEKLQKEQESLREELKSAKAKARETEQVFAAKLKETEDVADRTKKDLLAMELKYKQEDKHSKELEGDLRKTVSEKVNLQADLKKTSRNLSQCEANNAKLCTLAEEILKKYRKKGVAAALLQEEPLIQTKRVELEHFNQQYRDEIEKQKFQKR